MPVVNLLTGDSNDFRPQSARPTFKNIFLISDNNVNDPISPQPLLKFGKVAESHRISSSQNSRVQIVIPNSKAPDLSIRGTKTLIKSLS